MGGHKWKRDRRGVFQSGRVVGSGFGDPIVCHFPCGAKRDASINQHRFMTTFSRRAAWLAVSMFTKQEGMLSG